MSKKRSEFQGGILEVRAVEDCIRATKKYTEGIGTMRKRHPVQGEDFPSRMFRKYYEVYPEMDLEQILPFLDAVFAMSDWFWGETPCIDVQFSYDYRANKATVLIRDGAKAVRELEEGIPGFGDSLGKITINGDEYPGK